MALGFFSRLKEGLSRSTQKLTEGITTVFQKRRLDDAALEELEELLIAADLGTQAAGRVIAAFRRSRFGKEVTDAEVKQALAEEIAAILAPVARPLVLDPANKPHVILVVGVNGTGKTTTIGKLALQYWPAIPSEPRRWSNCRSGGSGLAPVWSPAAPGRIPPGWRSTR
jgi:fused signal recognition particle receptor